MYSTCETGYVLFHAVIIRICI